MKRSGYLKRNTRLSRGQPLKSAGRVKPVNSTRRTKRRAEDFGSARRTRWFNDQPCACLGVHPKCTGGFSEPAHVTSRGAGGKKDEIIPLSSGCHHEQHAKGWAAWHVQARRPEGFAQQLAARMATLGPDAPDGPIPV